MDMQNVSNLQIPEGAVRTIHDKDSRLIWGRLAYDTKYAGDNYQQTYSGKNLLNLPDTSVGNYGVTATSSNGVITLSGTASGTGNLGIPISLSLSAGTYTHSYNRTPSGRKEMNVSLSGSFNIGYSGNSVTATISGTTSYTYYRIGVVDGTNYNGVELKPQLESGSADTSWEPYVGGIPAPNPDYSQAVQTVTGEQTMTISDGVDSEAFPISLGSIELCKIGDYQDYIYKSGDDWYVHKVTKKVMFNGTEAWDKPQSDNVFRLPGSYSDMVGAAVAGSAVSDFFVFWPNSGGILNNLPNGQFGFVGTLANINFRYDTTTTISAWKTWLTNHNVSVYYALATPADTQITDTVLISQLNAVHEWMTRYGYNSVVTGNLPIIVDRTNL